MAELEPTRLPIPVGIALSSHRLDVAVPLVIERLEAEAHRAAAFLPSLVVGRVAADGLDLPIAMPGVLLGVELVRGGGATREAVVADQLLEHARGGAVRAAVHRLDEREE